ncbi:hypothetical protein BRC64_02800 [Halobacteriales archaeon QH_10_67_22]|nr:MAG: hypothetical protein BRC64_02800 [Halobacteriales archaeon QH_10_67_22]
MTDAQSRRGFLALACTVGLPGVAGCSESGDSNTEDGESDGDTGTEAPESGDGDTGTEATGEDGTESAGEDGTATPEPDLREANVVDVAVEGGDDGTTFDVTLYHDDDGEDGYANWWQVETLAGERLGRRDLTHAHSTAPFTRSETIDVPDGVSCVVVRGHDQTHEYGGQAMLVDLETGETVAHDQGAASRSFDAGDCP